MTEVQPPSADNRVFDWLGSDLSGVPYHLHPLNLVWSEAGVERDLAIYRGVAERLANDTLYWSSLIQDVNWRCTLVGCVCLLVRRHHQFFEDMLFRFEDGSMVIPQLAVTMGLLYPEEARSAFELVLDTPQLSNHAMRRASAERGLICLGGRAASKVTLDGLNVLDRDNAILADKVMREHWEFWSRRM